MQKRPSGREEKSREEKRREGKRREEKRREEKRREEKGRRNKKEEQEKDKKEEQETRRPSCHRVASADRDPKDDDGARGARENDSTHNDAAPSWSWHGRRRRRGGASKGVRSLMVRG